MTKAQNWTSRGKKQLWCIGFTNKFSCQLCCTQSKKPTPKRKQGLPDWNHYAVPPLAITAAKPAGPECVGNPLSEARFGSLHGFGLVNDTSGFNCTAQLHHDILSGNGNERITEAVRQRDARAQSLRARCILPSTPLTLLVP